MLGTGIHTGWSNLPRRPIFMPLATRLTFELAGTEPLRHETQAGMPLLFTLDGRTQPVNVEVRRPDGETIRLTTESSSRKGNAPAEDSKAERARGGQVLRYADTHAVGIYKLRTLDEVVPVETAMAVNADSDEADPAQIEHDELVARLEPTPLLLADDPAGLLAIFARLREGTSLWGFFLWGVLISLVVETFIANRLSPKARSLPPLPESGMLEEVESI
jgi:hypothetical protein